jgi:hypothetical protein
VFCLDLIAASIHCSLDLYSGLEQVDGGLEHLDGGLDTSTAASTPRQRP